MWHAGSGICSVRDAIEEPMAFLPDRRIVKMMSEARASTAHTIEQKHNWQDFADQAQQLCDNLDDTPTLRDHNLPCMATLNSWLGTESDAHVACYQQMIFIDSVAKQTPGINSRLESGGGKRCFTRVSYRVRDEEAAQSHGEESPACVSAVVKIKSCGDLQVDHGDTWDMIVADKDKLKRIEPALQEVAHLTISYNCARIITPAGFCRCHSQTACI